MAQPSTKFYICTICFKTSEAEEECHVLMVPVQESKMEDEARKPIEENGRLVTHAPRWFIEAQQTRKTD